MIEHEHCWHLTGNPYVHHESVCCFCGMRKSEPKITPDEHHGPYRPSYEINSDKIHIEAKDVIGLREYVANEIAMTLAKALS